MGYQVDGVLHGLLIVGVTPAQDGVHGQGAGVGGQAQLGRHAVVHGDGATGQVPLPQADVGAFGGQAQALGGRQLLAQVDLALLTLGRQPSPRAQQVDAHGELIGHALQQHGPRRGKLVQPVAG